MDSQQAKDGVDRGCNELERGIMSVAPNQFEM